MEHGSLQGNVLEELFSLPQLQQVKLKNNSFNSTLSLGKHMNPHLQLVDFWNNQITRFVLGASQTSILKLSGNPVCDSLVLVNYCQLQQQVPRVYSTNLAHCGSETCPSHQSHSPGSCECAYPYEGTLYFRAPHVRDLYNSSKFQLLESFLWTDLGVNPYSVSLQEPIFSEDDYIQVHLKLFPSSGKYFNRSEIQRLGFDLTNQTFKPPSELGPYYFVAFPYIFQDGQGGSSISLGAIIGTSVGCAVLLLMLTGVTLYVVLQKKRAERAIKLGKPFASWGSNGRESDGAPPQLKGARWFSYDELKTSTNNFSESNEIGSGGYGKVYKGILPDHQVVAIKRARQESMQGGLEFKNEIELLSRVHHKNLVSLIGFCFEKGEQMLVYEYVPNGTLREHLSGCGSVHLDWKWRLRVALCSPRGLAYLHELAGPSIIHRGIKSSNILLDEILNVKVADFGLSKLLSDSEMARVSTQIKGTLELFIFSLLLLDMLAH